METIINKIYDLLNNRETEEAVAWMFLASIAVTVFICIAAGIIFGASAVMLVIAAYIATIIRIVFGICDRYKDKDR